MEDRVRITVHGAGEPAGGGSDADVVLDPASARDLELFLTRIAPRDVTMKRPIMVWKDGARYVVDVHARAENGVWQVELGEQRWDASSLDGPERIDPRLNELTTPVWITDGDRLARWFNDAWCEFVGATLDDELGWGWMRHAYDDDLLGLLETYDEAQREGRGFDHVMRTADRDGAYWWAHIRALPRVVDEEFCGFIGICAITARADNAAPVASTLAAHLPSDLASAESPARTVERLQHLETTLDIVRPADALETAMLRRVVSHWVAQHPELRDRHDEIVLAIGEATTNAVLHSRSATGRVSLACERADRYAEFRVRDWGQWKPVSRGHDGHGITIMTELADEFELNHLDDGTEVVLRYAL